MLLREIDDKGGVDFHVLSATASTEIIRSIPCKISGVGVLE